MSDAQHPARIAYEGHLGGRGATLLLLGIAALVAGVLVITRHHHPTPYSMSSDTRPRLPDGRVASATGMSVADAIGRQPARLVAVHGYLEAAADDRPYLCARLDGFTDCRGVAHLRIAGSSQWLLVGRNRVRGVETGCCAIGSWSSHPVVLRGRVRDGVLLVQRPRD